MDAELSRRLAWYFSYLREADGLIDEERRHNLVSVAEAAQTFANLPDKTKAEIMEAELDYSVEEYPMLPTPWPLRDK